MRSESFRPLARLGRVGHVGVGRGPRLQLIDRVERADASAVQRRVPAIELAQGPALVVAILPVAVQLEIGWPRHRGRLEAAQQGGGHVGGSGDRRQARRRAVVGADADQVPREPAGAGVFVGGRAALDIVHRVEVAAGAVGEAAGVDNRQIAALVELEQRLGLVVEAEVDLRERVGHLPARVHIDVGVAVLDAQVGPGVGVVLVAGGRDKVERVAAAAQEDDHHNIARGCVGRVGEHQAAQPPAGQRRDGRAAADREFTSREVHRSSKE